MWARCEKNNIMCMKKRKLCIKSACKLYLARDVTRWPGESRSDEHPGSLVTVRGQMAEEETETDKLKEKERMEADG